jgi:hypothetical protein
MDNRRKSSSTITTTTTTHEFGGPPMAMAMTNTGSRSYSTMPNGRNSMPVPAPYHSLLRTPSYGSSVDRPLSPQLESPTTRGGNEETRNKRYSTMTTGTFGMRDRDQLESLAETEYVSYTSTSQTDFLGRSTLQRTCVRTTFRMAPC